MTRPLALIEGDLTIPLPRPFDGLPPPFGAHRRMLREAVQKAVEQVARPARAPRFPPGVTHILSYRASPQRVDTTRWDASMAEARRYLEMSNTRPRSSRSDHLLAASIFAGCTIALTWLLVTCSMKEAEKAKPLAVASAVQSSAKATDSPLDHSQQPVEPVVDATRAAALASTLAPLQTIASIGSAAPATPARYAEPVAVPTNPIAQAGSLPDAPKQSVSLSQAEPRPTAAPSPVIQKQAASLPQVTLKQSTQIAARDDNSKAPVKGASRTRMARLTEAHVSTRLALSRTVRPAAQPTVSTQPEWSARSSHDDGSVDQAPWLGWASQQHRTPPAMRATVPADNNWNDRMTQRRITDDPAAFHTGGSGK